MILMIIVFVLIFVITAWWTYLDWHGDSVVIPIVVGAVVAGIVVAWMWWLVHWLR